MSPQKGEGTKLLVTQKDSEDPQGHPKETWRKSLSEQSDQGLKTVLTVQGLKKAIQTNEAETVGREGEVKPTTETVSR